MIFALENGVLQPRANAMPAAEKFSRAGYDVAALLDPR
jgi:pilus assembly protein CpaF